MRLPIHVFNVRNIFTRRRSGHGHGLWMLVALFATNAWSQAAEVSRVVHSLSLEQGNRLSAIDLGVLPVEVATRFAFELKYPESEKWVIDVESDCTCLEVTTAPPALGVAPNPLEFTFTPNGSGSAEIDLHMQTLDADSGDAQTYTLPVKLVGFVASPPDWSVLDGFKTVRPMAAFQQLGAYRVIDIRGAVSYHNARIPGSFEYSLDELLAKDELLSGQVLLVGEAVLKRREAELLQQLVTQTNDLVWLEGGLSAWLRQGLPVEGRWPSSTQASTISLSRWLQGGASTAEWQVIDLSGQIPAGERFFGHSVLHPQGHQPEAIQQAILHTMEAALRKPQGRSVLVIGDARELVYPIAEVAARQDSPIQIFYLKNGVHAYQRWKQAGLQVAGPNLQTISLSSSSLRPAPGAPHRVGSAGNSGCSSCPKKR